MTSWKKRYLGPGGAKMSHEGDKRSRRPHLLALDQVLAIQLCLCQCCRPMAHSCAHLALCRSRVADASHQTYISKWVIHSAVPWSVVRRKNSHSKRTFLANSSMMGVISCTPSAMTPDSTQQHLTKSRSAPRCRLSWDVHVLQRRWAASSEGCHGMCMPKKSRSLSYHRDMTATLATVCHAP